MAALTTQLHVDTTPGSTALVQPLNWSYNPLDLFCPKRKSSSPDTEKVLKKLLESCMAVGMASDSSLTPAKARLLRKNDKKRKKRHRKRRALR